MGSENKLDRIIAARMKLKTRFLSRQSNSSSETKPVQGSGAANRHGMPIIPVGQTVTEKWPILDLGYHPNVTLDRWRLTIDGAVENPTTLKWKEFLDLPQTSDTSDFHCVTTWSKLDMKWKGVKLLDLAALVMPKDEVTHILCYGYDTYTTNLPIEEALKEDVMIVHTYDNEPLAKEHGGPARMITPQLYAWKGSKWIKRIKFLTADEKGFWEDRGYSNTAKPWENDRYSS